MAMLLIAALVVAGGIVWLVARGPISPAMRRRVNAGSDRYFAEQDHGSSFALDAADLHAGDHAGDHAADDGGDVSDGGDGGSSSDD